jgi:hypothetical protein
MGAIVLKANRSLHLEKDRVRRDFSVSDLLEASTAVDSASG